MRKGKTLSEVSTMRRCRKSWLIACAVAAWWLSHDVSASNAQPVQRYQPATPTVSPYLDLFRFNTGVLPNYQTFVQPQQRAQEYRQAQQWQNQQQARAIRQLQSNVRGLDQRASLGPLVAPTGKHSWFFQPSTRSTYLNTSGYYSQSGSKAAQ